MNCVSNDIYIYIFMIILIVINTFIPQVINYRHIDESSLNIMKNIWLFLI